MNIMMERDPRFIQVEQKVGTFILLAIVGIVAMLVFIGIQQDLFTPKTRIFFMADNGTGLSEGLSVKVRGFKVGKVTKVSMDDLGKVVVDLAINRTHMKWVRADSKAALKSEGIIGSGIIDISLGSPQERQLETGDRIAFVREKAISDVVNELQAQILPIITDIKGIISDLNDQNGDLKNTLRTTSQMMAELRTDIPTVTATTRKNMDTIGSSVKSLGTSLEGLSQRINTDVLGQVDNLLKNVNGTVQNVDQTVADMRTNVESIMKTANQTMENVRKTTETVEQTTATMPGMVEESRALLNDTQEMVDTLRQSVWLLRPKTLSPDDKQLKVNTDD